MLQIRSARVPRENVSTSLDGGVSVEAGCSVADGVHFSLSLRWVVGPNCVEGVNLQPMYRKDAAV
jgi:hypothetical protein